MSRLEQCESLEVRGWKVWEGDDSDVCADESRCAANSGSTSSVGFHESFDLVSVLDFPMPDLASECKVEVRVS